jgi:hypothetical protein
MINGRVVRVRSERDWPSQVADSWAWVVKSGQILPADAKVFMNVPESTFYYAASTFWFPRRVDVSFTPVGIRDDQQLRSIFLKDRWRLDPERLDELSQQAKAAGYTHLVTRKRDGEAVLMPLRDVAGGTNP